MIIRASKADASYVKNERDMNTYTVEQVKGGFKVRVIEPHGGAGHLIEELFATATEAEIFARARHMVETGMMGTSPEDRPA